MAALIHLIYLKPEILDKLRQVFKENNPRGIQITSFMDLISYKFFLKEISKVKFQKNKIMDMHSFFESKPDALNFFNSPEFLSFASILTGKHLTKSDCSLRMFMKGCYTLIHEETAEDGIEFFFDLTPKWDNEFGGYTAYLAYDGSKVITPQYPNTLILAESGRSYVKYVNHLAKSDGRLVVYGKLS